MYYPSQERSLRGVERILAAADARRAAAEVGAGAAAGAAAGVQAAAGAAQCTLSPAAASAALLSRVGASNQGERPAAALGVYPEAPTPRPLPVASAPAPVGVLSCMLTY